MVGLEHMVAKTDDRFSAVVEVKGLDRLDCASPNNGYQVIDEVILKNLFFRGGFVP